MITVTILGNNSAVPTFNRHPTSQVVTIDNRNFLVDCGEGTQIQMIKYKIRRSRISHIFISHLHGDHYFGLVGLINSFGLLGRTQDLHIFSPAPLKEIITMQLNVAETHFSFNLYFHNISKEGVLVDDEQVTVSCFKTNHRIECYGFLFKEKRKPRKLLHDKAVELNIPVTFFENLRNGEDYITADGTCITNDIVTDKAPKGDVYAYCADTKYDEAIIPHIAGADMIYHETTYLNNLVAKAQERYHSTSVQAATIAVKAGVKKLLIGHFSSKYDSLEEFETEAREVFPNTFIAKEGEFYNM